MIFNPKHIDKIKLPSGWKLELLGNYSNIVTSFKTFQKIKDEYEKNNNGLPIHYLKVSDMNLEGNKIFFLNSNNTFYSGVKKNLDKGFLKPNSLVFPKRGAAIATNKKRITSTYSVLDPNLIGVEPNYEIEINFLYLFFELFDLKWLQDNNVIPQLNKHNVAGVNFPLPPLPEQRKIAYVLSTVQKAIEQQDKLIRHTTELKKALMQKLFTEGLRGEKQKQTEIGFIPESWEVIELGDICARVSVNVQPNPNGEKPYVGLEHIVPGQIYLTSRGKESDVVSSKAEFKKGEILYGKLRPYLDKAAIAHFDGISSTDILIFIGKNEVQNDFLIHFFHTESFIDFAKSTTTGVQHPRTSWSSLKKLKLALPPKSERKLIAQTLNLFEDKLSFLQKKKQTLSSLFKTLLHELMTGERRVNEIEFEASGKEYNIKEQPLILAAEK